ncbi:MAG: penicillin-binding protein 2 [Candidatus Kerfeldbacteria bacterium]|nr:penicillin-binding protein 2 [Candidatus Kerfeldbacteria bacterium]
MTDPFGPASISHLRPRVFHRTESIDSDVRGQPGIQPDIIPHRQTGVNWLGLTCALVLTIFVGRLYFLQIVEGQTYRQRSERNRIQTEVISAPRGSIVDRYGQPLVSNAPNFLLTVTPADIPSAGRPRQDEIDQLAAIIHRKPDEIKNAISDRRHRSTDPVTIVDHAPESEAIDWMVQTASMPGVRVTSVPTRQYLDGPNTSAILGYIGVVSGSDLEAHPQLTPQSVNGKTGLEKQYDVDLTGQDGFRDIERDVRNQSQAIVRQQDSQPGKTLTLTIDRQLQIKLSERLLAEIKVAHSPGGSAVALNPQTGEILALVSAPAFDNNWFVTPGHSDQITTALQDPARPFLNRAISGLYPSGSIIKPLLAAAGLHEHVVTPDTTVVSTGGITVGSDHFPDWKSGGHGITNLAKALAESVNTYFYILGGGYQGKIGLGVDRMVKYLQAFGWGSKTGVDLPGESQGLLPTKEWRQTTRATPWKLGDTYHLSIGQGDLQVTPLQIASGLSAIANGGTLYQPHLVSTVTDANNQIVRTYAPTVLRTNIVSSTDIMAVQNGMRQGVLNGSSRSLQSLPVPAAGKTGTAQFGREGKTHAWFAAYAPYDHPTILIVVMVEAGGEGNATALPVAKDVLQWFFSRNQHP